MATDGNYRKLAVMSALISVSGIIFMIVGIGYYPASFLSVACYVANTPLSLLVWAVGMQSIERMDRDDTYRVKDGANDKKKARAVEQSREKLERERKKQDVILIISFFSVFAYMFLFGAVVFAIQTAAGVQIPINPGMGVSWFLLAMATCVVSSYQSRSKFICRQKITG